MSLMSSEAVGMESEFGAMMRSALSVRSAAEPRNSSRNFSVSAGPLFIFQLAAMISLRDIVLF